jgi:hypothetical protein
MCAELICEAFWIVEWSSENKFRLSLSLAKLYSD